MMLNRQSSRRQHGRFSFVLAYPQSIDGIDRPRVRKLARVLNRIEIGGFHVRGTSHAYAL
jgi:hypothetical protein